VLPLLDRTSSLQSGRATMRDGKTLLRFAEECAELAKKAAPQHRDILLEMAETWHRLARQSDCRLSYDNRDAR
jgi:hypothetical protein